MTSLHAFLLRHCRPLLNREASLALIGVFTLLLCTASAPPSAQASYAKPSTPAVTAIAEPQGAPVETMPQAPAPPMPAPPMPAPPVPPPPPPPPLVVAERPARLTFYDCLGQDFCGEMANGEIVYQGAAACSYDLDLGTTFTIAGDPTGRIYVCKDRGLLPNTHVDIFWHNPDDGWEWQAKVGEVGTVAIIVDPPPPPPSP
jgi:hypothetical protein